MGACCTKLSKVSDDPSRSQSRWFNVLRWHGPTSEAGAGPDPVVPGPAGPVVIEKVAAASAVKVAVVVRPLLPAEVAAGARDVVNIAGPGQLSLPHRATVGGAPIVPQQGDCAFAFDKVVRADGPKAIQQFHKDMVSNVLERFVQGFNGTILAYGQTGSGKTYTMGTGCGGKELAAALKKGRIGQAMMAAGGPAAGVVPRAINHVFEHLERTATLYDSRLKMTYVELYQEQIQDLLAPNPASSGTPAATISVASLLNTGGSAASSLMPACLPPVAIREGPRGSIILDGATEISVTSREQIAWLIARGNERRATGAHRLNEESSRSHAVVTLTLEQHARPGAAVPSDLEFLRSKLSLVDLAGSERVKQTGSTGTRFLEGISINSGLLALGNVINALAQQQSARNPRAARRIHIPYRDSKLTRLLQDGLGGNSETLFIACISPSNASHEHSLSTLRYASRASLISNNLQLNNGMTTEEELAYLRTALVAAQSEAAALRAELAGLRLELSSMRLRELPPSVIRAAETVVF